MDLTDQIAEIFILGLIGGAMPGPILTGVFAEVLSGGFKRGLEAIVRALIAETIVAVSILSFISFLDVPRAYFEAISLLGAAFMLYLARGVWQINGFKEEAKEVFTFSRIFLLTVLNSGFVIYWLTICAPMAFALDEWIAYGEAVFVAVFEAGWLIAVMILSYLFSRFRPLLLKKDLISPLFKFSALVLTFFALDTIWESVRFLAGRSG
jgi:threonine/homoserine/homoserine lactone efflux protein